MKRIIYVFLVLILSLFCAGCYSGYTGPHLELQVVARNSLLGVTGWRGDQILVLETDEYGRNLFAYNSTNSITTNGYVIAVLVSQKTTEKDSYFYDGKNAIYCERTDGKYMLTDESVYYHFTEEQIEKLKHDNDWNKPIDEDKLFSADIIGYDNSNIIPIKTQREAFLTVSDKKEFHPSYSRALTIDQNGKSLYLMRGHIYDDVTKENYYTKSYLVMFDADKKLIDQTGIMEITDLENYTEQLNEFKKLNNWAFS